MASLLLLELYCEIPSVEVLSSCWLRKTVTLRLLKLHFKSNLKPGTTVWYALKKIGFFQSPTPAVLDQINCSTDNQLQHPPQNGFFWDVNGINGQNV